ELNPRRHKPGVALSGPWFSLRSDPVKRLVAPQQLGSNNRHRALPIDTSISGNNRRMTVLMGSRRAWLAWFCSGVLSGRIDQILPLVMSLHVVGDELALRNHPFAAAARILQRALRQHAAHPLARQAGVNLGMGEYQLLALLPVLHDTAGLPG